MHDGRAGCLEESPDFLNGSGLGMRVKNLFLKNRFFRFARREMLNISLRFKPAQVDRPETFRKSGPLFTAVSPPSCMPLQVLFARPLTAFTHRPPSPIGRLHPLAAFKPERAGVGLHQTGLLPNLSGQRSQPLFYLRHHLLIFCQFCALLLDLCGGRPAHELLVPKHPV